MDSTTHAHSRLPIIGYIRVSTDKQDISPDVQRAALIEAAEREGYDLTLIEELSVSAATVAKRPKMLAILSELRAGTYAGLMVYTLDRLSRSMEDGTRLLADSQRQGWRIICLNLNVDTASIMGGAMYNMALNFAEVERKQIGKRTRDAMRQKIKEGHHMGRARSLPLAVVEQIVALRQVGHTMKAIAEELNAEKVPTSTGMGKWTTSKVQSVLKSKTAKQVQEGVDITVPARSMNLPS